MQLFAFDNIQLSSAIHGLFVGLILMKITFFGIAYFSYEDSLYQNHALQIEASNTQLIGEISLNAQKIAAQDVIAHQDLQANTQRLLNQLALLKYGGISEADNQVVEKDESHQTLLTYMMQLSKEIQYESSLLYQLSFRADSLGNQYLKSDLNYSKQTYFLRKIAEKTENLHHSNERLKNTYQQAEDAAHRYKKTFIILFFVINLIILIFIYRWVLKQVMNEIEKTLESSKNLVDGNLNILTLHPPKDEIGSIIRNINQLALQLLHATEFATEVGQGKFDTHFTPVSEYDRLGKALLEMRDNLRDSTKASLIRRRTNEGIALFNDLLKNIPEEEEEFGYQVISALVKFLNANQGGFYVIEQDEEQKSMLCLKAHYAYNKRKYLTQKVPLETGILGQTIHEKQTIITRDLPQDYVIITSGLGEATPTNLISVPLVHNELVFGVLELASFHIFQSYEVEFIERISENIASVLATVKNNQRMKNLLDEAQMYSEQVTAQEEELRMSLEQFSATQEENEKQIRQTKEKLEILEKIQEIRDDLIFIIDDKFHLTYMNHTLYEAYQQGGINPVIGMYVPDLFPENERDIQIERYQKALTGEKVFVEHTLEDANAQKIYFETTYQKMDARQVLVISREITHLK